MLVHTTQEPAPVLLEIIANPLPHRRHTRHDAILEFPRPMQVLILLLDIIGVSVIIREPDPLQPFTVRTHVARIRLRDLTASHLHPWDIFDVGDFLASEADEAA